MVDRGSRREVLRAALGVGVGVWLGETARAAESKSPNERVNFACIGVDGKGESDTEDAALLGNVVAICDVDEALLNKAAQKYPNARKFTDYRKMLDQMHRGIDAVTISTPDHSHAPAAAMAMHLGKHCFCQKPLTHSIHEARRLGEIAREKNVATQMGNQGTSENSLRKNAALVRAGALGTVSEVHVWTNRPSWPQGDQRPAAAAPPAGLNWDLWLGPAPERPYAEGYHRFAWRGWWDFGTGALGDMACHLMNLPFMALDLRDPAFVRAQTSGYNRESYPRWSIIKYQFLSTKTRPGLTLTWYDGGKHPALDLLPRGRGLAEGGSLIIGDKGVLYTPGDYGSGGKIHGGVDVGEVHFEESPGHFHELVRAIKTGVPAMSNFPDYAAPLTETVLLGNLAVWADGARVEWDAKRQRAHNLPDLSALVKPKYREGYSL